MLTYLSIFLVTLLLCPGSFAGNGTISLAKGTVYLKKIDSESEEIRARRGQNMEPGDSLRTEQDSYAKLTMSDKNLIHVGPNTEFVLEAYDTEEAGEGSVKISKLNVLYGKVRTALEQKYDGKKSKFRVTTEAAVLGVRGTDFLTEHSDISGQTRATTFDGVVAMAGIDENGDILGEQTISAGQMSLVTPGDNPLKPITLPEGVLQNIKSGSSRGAGKHSFKADVAKKLDSTREIISTGHGIPKEARRRPRTHNRQLLDPNIITKAGGGEGKINITVTDNP